MQLVDLSIVATFCTVAIIGNILILLVKLRQSHQESLTSSNTFNFFRSSRISSCKQPVHGERIITQQICNKFEQSIYNITLFCTSMQEHALTETKFLNIQARRLKHFQTQAAKASEANENYSCMARCK